MPDTPELLTVGQAAQRLGVGVLTVRAWVRTEQCPVVRDGRRVRMIPAIWAQRRGTGTGCQVSGAVCSVHAVPFQ